jgi:predicted nucleic acid-binding protein
MIVADTNLIAHFCLRTEQSGIVERLFLREPGWIAPSLWYHEFLNVLAKHMRLAGLTSSQALDDIESARELLAGRVFDPSPKAVLDIIASSSLSSYDAEFVALAIEQHVPLVTFDKRICTAVPQVAVSPEAFLQRLGQ